MDLPKLRKDAQTLITDSLCNVKSLVPFEEHLETLQGIDKMSGTLSPKQREDIILKIVALSYLNVVRDLISAC